MPSEPQTNTSRQPHTAAGITKPGNERRGRDAADADHHDPALIAAAPLHRKHLADVGHADHGHGRNADPGQQTGEK